MQQATLAQSVEQRIRNAQVVSSSLMSGSEISRIKALRISQLLDSQTIKKRVIFSNFRVKARFFSFFATIFATK